MVFFSEPPYIRAVCSSLSMLFRVFCKAYVTLFLSDSRLAFPTSCANSRLSSFFVKQILILSNSSIIFQSLLICYALSICNFGPTLWADFFAIRDFFFSANGTNVVFGKEFSVISAVLICFIQTFRAIMPISIQWLSAPRAQAIIFSVSI